MGLVTFRVGFLLGFSASVPEQHQKGKEKTKKDKKDKKKKDKKKKDKKKKDKKKGKDKSSKTTSEVQIKEEPPKPEYVLDVGPPIGFAHIEYTLIPDRPKQQVDVVCWRGVAKVFFEEGDIIYRIKLTEDKAWVPVFIEHCMNTFEDDELIKLHQHVIEFKIYSNKSKVAQKAKSEKTKVFYLKLSDVHSDDLVPVFTEDPNLVEEKKESPSAILDGFIKDLIVSCIYKPGIKNQKEVISKLSRSDITFKHWMDRMILEGTEDFFFKEYISNSPPPMTEDEIITIENPPIKEIKIPKKSKKKEDKKKDKKKEKKKKKDKKSEKKSKKSPKMSNEMSVKVSGEIFFTDPNLAMFDVRNPNLTITNGYVLLAVEKLMTRQQKYDLNPFVVKIDKIDDLDVETLRKLNFDSIFVRYNIPFLMRGETIPRDIKKLVRFSESHAHFIKDLPSMKLVEFIQTQRFFVEICGKRNDLTPDVKSDLFGSKRNDDRISKRLSPTEAFFKLQKNNNETVINDTEVIAVVGYDLSPLLIPSWGVSANQACHNPDNIQYKKVKLSPIEVDETFITANNINIKTMFTEHSKNSILEYDLIEFGTTLKVEFAFAAPINLIAHSVGAKAENLNRMFLVVKKLEMAERLIDFLLNHNEQLGGDKISPNRTRSNHEIDLDSESYMTGFIIDNGTTFAFYIEGSIKDYMMPLWEKMMRSSPEDVKIYYNDRMIFTKRLYKYFVKMGGFCIITMQRPLKDILSMEKVYLEGYIPSPCWDALKKLDLLFRSPTLKDMTMYNLFPTVDELLSFDLEFGTCMRWNECYSAQKLVSISSASFYSSES
ncbi:uncharacterized protein [Onthophagus taurus]|uniref:uncharacterized protein n=1 Tax=Onthophagus taurus TaxID=166361 RepID=UPI0039BEA415